MSFDFADYLVSERIIDASAVSEIETFRAAVPVSVADAALKLGLARPSDLLRASSSFYQLPCVGTQTQPLPQVDAVQAALTQLSLSQEWIVAHRSLCWFTPDSAEKEQGDPSSLNIALVDPADSSALEEAQRRHAGPLNLWLVSSDDHDRIAAELLSRSEELSDADDAGATARLRELAEEAPVIDFVNNLFNLALDRNASDIHVEPFETFFETRLRVDGVLTETARHPRGMFDSVSTRIKILSGMDISERRLPQDGRQTIRVAGEEIDLRVSSLPATDGESIVIRLLRKKSDLPDMQSLGLRGQNLTSFQRLIDLPNGMFLVSGPTGSGKSTTLYRALEYLDRSESKIITIEDPVEYDVEGVNQVQVHSEIGLTFASGLRAMLRQDPDVIMVGEIRDRETAEVAVQAALTGHLVFSTLHTNSAVGAYERLIDLGVEPFLLSAALRGVLGQRLLRKLCEHCKRPASDADKDLVKQLSKSGTDIPAPTQVCEAVGCSHCDNSGYSGRIGVYELVDIHAMSEAGLTGDLRDMMKPEVLETFGYRSMLDDALLKVGQGESSLSEIARVFGRRAIAKG
jgi:general secretion pathway protein E